MGGLGAVFALRIVGVFPRQSQTEEVGPLCGIYKRVAETEEGAQKTIGSVR